MAITLEDGRKVLVRPPKKKLYEKLIEFRNDKSKNNFDGLLELSANILSDNISGYVFTPGELEEMFDIDDMKALISEYNSFITGTLKNPN